MEVFELPELPGRKFFRCERRRATIGVEACDSMRKEAYLRGSSGRFWLCLGCPTGSEFFGPETASKAPLRSKDVCGRCLRGTTRLINGHLCPSCANRGYEWVRGKNAKGNPLVEHPPLYALAIRYFTDGAVKVRKLRYAVNTTELVVAALRDEPKQSIFALMTRKPEGVAWN